MEENVTCMTLLTNQLYDLQNNETEGLTDKLYIDSHVLVTGLAAITFTRCSTETRRSQKEMTDVTHKQIPTLTTDMLPSLGAVLNNLRLSFFVLGTKKSNLDVTHKQIISLPWKPGIHGNRAISVTSRRNHALPKQRRPVKMATVL